MKLAGGPREEEQNCFINCLTCKLGNAQDINFWRDKWIGLDPLCKLFPCFLCSLQDKCKVFDMGSWVDNVYV